MSDYQRGTVKFFNDQKGYGFIVPEDGGRDIFVHVSAVKRANIGDIKEGDVLEFVLEDNRGKTQAAKLRRA